MPRETKKKAAMDDVSITSRSSLLDLPLDDPSRPATISRSTVNAPWLLQQHFAGKVDLAAELTNRYPTWPLMTVIKQKPAKGAHQPSLSTLAAPDGTATLLFEAMPDSHQCQLAYTLSSMLTLRFRMNDLTPVDCAHWLAFIKLEAIKVNTKKNYFAIKSILVINAMKVSMRKLQTLKQNISL